jgi:membrane-associated phospholipid phosphatase
LVGGALLPARALSQPPYKLRFSLGVTLAVDTPALAGYVVLETLVPPPEHCMLCVPPAADVAIADLLGSPEHRASAAIISDWGLWGSWIGGAVLALLGGAAEHRFGRAGWKRGAEDIAIVAEAALTTGLLIDIAKLATARRRPDEHFGLPSGRRRNESFASGHAAQAAALASASTAVAYLRDYDFKLVVPISGSALALTVGLLRIVAVRHWASDVLAGWVLGTAVGIALPLLLHPRLDEPVAAAGTPAAPATSVPLVSGAF